MAVLDVLSPSGRVTFELDSLERMTIGRREANDITIGWDSAVSRHHAELEYVAGSWFVSDLDSANGTFVNGARVAQKRKLHVDDELRIGDTCLYLRGMTTSEPASTTSPASKPPDLTRKQHEVLHELCRPQARDPREPCATVKDIAARMFVGEAAVKAHLSPLYEKFEIAEVGQQRRALLAKKAWNLGAVRSTDYEDEPDDRTLD
jgi:hypothetical protein